MKTDKDDNKLNEDSVSKESYKGGGDVIAKGGGDVISKDTTQPAPIGSDDSTLDKETVRTPAKED